ncbi:hypothetical protein BWR15_25355 [Pseudomonas sp. T]|nr:hypothetical protein BWR15_25355 [Pseudomonas sp. T]
MTLLDHLVPSVRELIELPKAQRVSVIQGDRFYIDHPQSSEIIKMIENVVSVPRRTQAPCMIVTGASGSGKTSIIQQMRLNKEMVERVVFIDMAANPFNLKFGDLLVSAMGLPANLIKLAPSRRVLMPAELIEVIRLRRIKALVIDELQDSMLAARTDQQRNLSIMKWFTNPDVGVSIFGFGVHEARNALKLDEQLARRFFSVEIRDWGEDETFRSFLAGIEMNLPLRQPSRLDCAEIVGCLLQHTSGRMSSVISLLKSAACYAVNSGEERITVASLNHAATHPWSY